MYSKTGIYPDRTKYFSEFRSGSGWSGLGGDAEIFEIVLIRKLDFPDENEITFIGNKRR